MTKNVELTICTVSFNSAACLNANYRLTEILNPSASVLWIVAENSPTALNNDLYPKHPSFRLVKGAAFPDDRYAAASHHHAAALNMAVQKVESRFLLVLDPDFYVVRRNWVTEITRHMVERELSFFGVPWHPSRFTKWRYFPCVHCMLIDLERVQRDTLDFFPDFPATPAYKLGKSGSSQGHYGQILRRIMDPLKFRKRRHIGASRDTSWRIYARYHADPLHKSECIQPVYSAPTNTFQSYADYMLPERYALIPKRGGYFVRKGFKEHGLTDFRAMGCEEFFWKNEPFGVHIRSHPKSSKGHSIDRQLEAIDRLVESLRESSAPIKPHDHN
jgi:hypothetical protein